jgi:hypothetical protein
VFDLGWDRLRSGISENGRSSAARAAGEWSVDVLSAQLGPNWLRRAFESDRELALNVLWADSHLIAFTEFVELALRFHLLSGVPKLAAVRKELVQDVRSERWRHARLQLEVASLARWHGAEVTIEQSATPGVPPADVEIHLPEIGAIRVETFTVFVDEAMRAAMGYDEQVGFRQMALRVQYDVSFAGELPPRLDADGTDRFFEVLEGAAKEVKATGIASEVSFGGAIVHVDPQFMAEGDRVLSGPPHVGDPFSRARARFVQKADQAAKAGVGWLRVDEVDGIFQFTDWGQRSLQAKLRFIGEYLPESLSASHLDGIVLSSGACIGTMSEESCSNQAGGLALRRLIAPARVRETFIVPLSQTGHLQARTWFELYDKEPGWLPYAVEEAGLKQVPEFLGDFDSQA